MNSYDRRHLTQGSHRIELRDRSLRDSGYDEWNIPVLQWNDRLLESYTTCGQAVCTVGLLRKAGIPEGVDAYGGPVPVGGGREVHVVPLVTDGPNACDHCGNSATH